MFCLLIPHLKKIRDYLEESVNKTLPAPEITIGEETKYNPCNNKIYIGQNKNNNNDYFGSGKKFY